MEAIRGNGTTEMMTNCRRDVAWPPHALDRDRGYFVPFQSTLVPNRFSRSTTSTTTMSTLVVTTNPFGKHREIRTDVGLSVRAPSYKRKGILGGTADTGAATRGCHKP